MTTTTPKIFGQSKPDANTTTVLYTAPLNKRAQVTIFVCSQTGGGSTFSIKLVRPPPADAGDVAYISRNTPLIGNGVFAFSSIGIDSEQAIIVESNSGQVSFTATGIEFG